MLLGYSWKRQGWNERLLNPIPFSCRFEFEERKDRLGVLFKWIQGKLRVKQLECISIGKFSFFGEITFSFFFCSRLFKFDFIYRGFIARNFQLFHIFLYFNTIFNLKCGKMLILRFAEWFSSFHFQFLYIFQLIIPMFI